MVTMTDPTSNDTPTVDGAKGQSPRWGCLALIVAPILIVGGCAALSVSTPEKPKDYFTIARYSAESACEKRVEGMLKSPSTAKFTSSASVTPTSSGYSVKVTGTVDSQNSFGAMIRTPYRCTVTTDAEGGPESVALETLG